MATSLVSRPEEVGPLNSIDAVYPGQLWSSMKKDEFSSSSDDDPTWQGQPVGAGGKVELAEEFDAEAEEEVIAEQVQQLRGWSKSAGREKPFKLKKAGASKPASGSLRAPAPPASRASPASTASADDSPTSVIPGAQPARVPSAVPITPYDSPVEDPSATEEGRVVQHVKEDELEGVPAASSDQEGLPAPATQEARHTTPGPSKFPTPLAEPQEPRGTGWLRARPTSRPSTPRALAKAGSAEAAAAKPLPSVRGSASAEGQMAWFRGRGRPAGAPAMADSSSAPAKAMGKASSMDANKQKPPARSLRQLFGRKLGPASTASGAEVSTFARGPPSASKGSPEPAAFKAGVSHGAAQAASITSPQLPKRKSERRRAEPSIVWRNGITIPSQGLAEAAQEPEALILAPAEPPPTLAAAPPPTAAEAEAAPVGVQQIGEEAASELKVASVMQTRVPWLSGRGNGSIAPRPQTATGTPRMQRVDTPAPAKAGRQPWRVGSPRRQLLASSYQDEQGSDYAALELDSREAGQEFWVGAAGGADAAQQDTLQEENFGRTSGGQDAWAAEANARAAEHLRGGALAVVRPQTAPGRRAPATPEGVQAQQRGSEHATGKGARTQRPFPWRPLDGIRFWGAPKVARGAEEKVKVASPGQEGVETTAKNTYGDASDESQEQGATLTGHSADSEEHSPIEGGDSSKYAEGFIEEALEVSADTNLDVPIEGAATAAGEGSIDAEVEEAETPTEAQVGPAVVTMADAPAVGLCTPATLEPEEFATATGLGAAGAPEQEEVAGVVSIVEKESHVPDASEAAEEQRKLPRRQKSLSINSGSPTREIELALESVMAAEDREAGRRAGLLPRNRSISINSRPMSPFRFFGEKPSLSQEGAKSTALQRATSINSREGMSPFRSFTGASKKEQQQKKDEEEATLSPRTKLHRSNSMNEKRNRIPGLGQRTNSISATSSHEFLLMASAARASSPSLQPASPAPSAVRAGTPKQKRPSTAPQPLATYNCDQAHFFPPMAAAPQVPNALPPKPKPPRKRRDPVSRDSRGHRADRPFDPLALSPSPSLQSLNEFNTDSPVRFMPSPAMSEDGVRIKPRLRYVGSAGAEMGMHEPRSARGTSPPAGQAAPEEEEGQAAAPPSGLHPEPNQPSAEDQASAETMASPHDGAAQSGARSMEKDMSRLVDDVPSSLEGDFSSELVSSGNAEEQQAEGGEDGLHEAEALPLPSTPEAGDSEQEHGEPECPDAQCPPEDEGVAAPEDHREQGQQEAVPWQPVAAEAEDTTVPVTSEESLDEEVQDEAVSSPASAEQSSEDTLGQELVESGDEDDCSESPQHLGQGGQPGSQRRRRRRVVVEEESSQSEWSSVAPDDLTGFRDKLGFWRHVEEKLTSEDDIKVVYEDVDVSPDAGAPEGHAEANMGENPTGSVAFLDSEEGAALKPEDSEVHDGSSGCLPAGTGFERESQSSFEDAYAPHYVAESGMGATEWLVHQNWAEQGDAEQAEFAAMGVAGNGQVWDGVQTKDLEMSAQWAHGQGQYGPCGLMTIAEEDGEEQEEQGPGLGDYGSASEKCQPGVSLAEEARLQALKLEQQQQQQEELEMQLLMQLRQLQMQLVEQQQEHQEDEQMLQMVMQMQQQLQQQQLLYQQQLLQGMAP